MYRADKHNSINDNTQTSFLIHKKKLCFILPIHLSLYTDGFLSDF